MTQEDKQLLLQDLCARLPFEVKAHAENVDLNGTISGLSLNSVFLLELHDWWDIEFIKPYLRPMSSMTEEEKKEYAKVVVKSQDCSYKNNESATTMVNDWYLSKGFDVRGLIPKGLALEAPEGMYEY